MSFYNWYKSIYPLTLEADVFKLVESAWEQSAKEEREANKEACRQVSAQGIEKASEFWHGHHAGADACFNEINKRSAPKDEVSE